MSNSDIINEYNQSFCRNCHRQFDDSASCSNWQPSLIIRRPRQKRKLLMNSQDKGLWRQINAKPPNNHSLFCLLSMGTRDQSKLLFSSLSLLTFLVSFITPHEEGYLDCLAKFIRTLLEFS